MLAPERPLHELGAEIIGNAFDAYQKAFREITGRARLRYEVRDWHGFQKDGVERLDLYSLIVTSTVGSLRRSLGATWRERPLWARIKGSYSRAVAERGDGELAETFLNSVTRRIFATVGVDPAIEFVDSDFDRPPGGTGPPLVRSFAFRGSGAELAAQILGAFPFRIPYARAEWDARAVGARIEAAVREARLGPLEGADLVRSVFFRGKGAYLVGRLRLGGGLLPLLLCVLHEQGGLAVDAVLLDEDSASIVFGFTRAYFHVEAERPHELVGFLKTIMPLKKTAELYIAIGHNKHGKTELYRDLLRHLRCSRDCFEIARGDRGLVMAVFTLPSYDLVFKIIRDRFAPPKETTRERVMGKYALVFHHDRAGRLIDAQEFEHLEFARQRFSEALLRELLEAAAGSVSVQGDRVAIRHLYAERRLTPLNLHLREAGEKEARAAVLDYGEAIRDLAASNVFPGDVLLKNFGLTRHGRVVFYDYDELGRITEQCFRELPEPPGDHEEMEAQPWFYVAENDVFPEEFERFLGLPAPLRQAFLSAHRELLRPEFWRRMQERLRAGEIVDIFPYRAEQRLRPGEA